MKLTSIVFTPWLVLAGASCEPAKLRNDMVAIPAGPFHAGCNPAQLAAEDSCKGDLAYRVVNLRNSLLIDRTEVTVEDYARCCKAGPCAQEARRSPDYRGICGNFAYPRLARHPMTDVNVDEARTYCTWRGKRLPTEVEWEKAARGIDGRPYPWGWRNPSAELLVYEVLTRTYSQPVGSRPAGASPYGVLDMAGNVDEWTEPATPAPFAVALGAVATWSPITSQMLGHRRVIEDRFARFYYVGFRCAKSQGEHVN